jgi:nucleotide-binding universal stress UspA family protein
MQPRPTIVCAIDDSDRGRAAACVAVHLAERLDLALVGAHAVLPLPLTAAGIPYAVPPPDPRAAARCEAAAAMHAREVLDEAGAGEARLRTAVGQVADVLIRVADEEDALMLVLGTSEAGPLRSLVLGSVTESVLQSAERPVLAVRAGVDSEFAGPVVAALGGPQDVAWIARAESLALALRGALVLAHVIDAGDDAADDPALAEAESRVEAFDPALRTLGASEALIETRIGFGAPGDTLLALARASDAGMIVTGCHQHSRLHTALVGSTARRLLRDAGVPVLVCPSPANMGARAA